MNYIKVYNSLIERAIGRELDANSYYEKHHIIPKSKGGTDDPSNIVYLTYREHIIAHWLLHTNYPTDKQLAAAFHMTVFGSDPRAIRGNDSYIGISKYIPSTRILEAARIAKMNARIGTKHTDETKAKIAESHRSRASRGLKNKPRKEYIVKESIPKTDDELLTKYNRLMNKLQSSYNTVFNS